MGKEPSTTAALGYVHGESATPRLVRDEPWRAELGPKWFRPDQLSYRGLCAWNHTEDDLVPATRLVVTEDSRGVQDARACCDDCYASVIRYVRGPSAAGSS
jgi:hypothetical protein